MEYKEKTLIELEQRYSFKALEDWICVQGD